MTRVLGIETSCDETSASVVDWEAGGTPDIRSLVILSQDVHAIFGGVVPEIASRAHLTAIVPVVQRALTQAGCALPDVDAIAVTHAPGLAGALLVGLCYAKGLAAAAGRPCIGVHHMEGHLFATALDHPGAQPPFVALLISGGHTMLLDVPAWGTYTWLGGTRDDAAGEAFDKVGKLLGLPYPGGPHIERLARTGDPARFRFARPMLRRDQQPADPEYYDLSFSGLKTAVRLAVEGSDDRARDTAHIARGFQDAVIDTLVAKVLRACRARGRTRVVLGGGVACNRTLADAMRTGLSSLGGEVFAPSPRLATDNAAMIAAAGAWHLTRGERSPWTLDARAQAPIPGLERPR